MLCDAGTNAGGVLLSEERGGVVSLVLVNALLVEENEREEDIEGEDESKVE